MMQGVEVDLPRSYGDLHITLVTWVCGVSVLADTDSVPDQPRSTNDPSYVDAFIFGKHSVHRKTARFEDTNAVPCTGAANLSCDRFMEKL